MYAKYIFWSIGLQSLGTEQQWIEESIILIFPMRISFTVRKDMELAGEMIKFKSRNLSLFFESVQNAKYHPNPFIYSRQKLLLLIYQFFTFQQHYKLMEKGYQVSLDKNRTSAVLTNSSTSIITQYFKQKGISLQQSHIIYFTRDGNPYSTTRTFPGPNPQLRIVTVVRSIAGVQQLNYFGIYLINLSVAEENKISHQILYEMVSDKSKKIRNIVCSPNRKQLIIVYDQFVEKYRIQLKTEGKGLYKLEKIGEAVQNLLKQSISIEYGPSGQYAYGLRYEKIKQLNQTRSQLYVYKLTTKNLTYSEAQVDNCNYPQNYVFMSPWLQKISMKQDLGIFAAYKQGTACLFDTSSLFTQKTSFDPNVPPNIYELHTNSTQTSTYNLTGYNFSMTVSVGNLMIKNKPQFIFYDSVNMGHYFDPLFTSDTNNLFQVISSTNNTTNNTGQIKCIDISQIDAFACIKNGLSSVFVNKIINNNKKKDPVYVQRLLEINNDSALDLLIQDIFYHSLTNQLCYYVSNQIRCSEIKVKCQSNSTVFSSPEQCDSFCKKTHLDTFWSPISFTCEKCSAPTCLCNPGQEFDSNLNQCTFSCSAIPKAVPESQYYKSGQADNKQLIYYKAKCACQPPYIWFEKFNNCRLDCFGIEKNNVIYYDNLKIDECSCIKKYKFVKDESNPNGGLCQYVCPNSELAVVINNKNVCKCEKNQIWNPNLQQCVLEIQKQIQTQNHSTPAWAIILIVIASLILLGTILYCIWKKCKGKNGKLIAQRSSITSQDTDRNKMPTTNQNINDEKKEQQRCVICKNQQETNCKGPCNHSYHFQCINSEIIQGKNFCPACFKQFPKGISDLIIVDKKQVFSIGDEDEQNQ